MVPRKIRPYWDESFFGDDLMNIKRAIEQLKNYASKYIDLNSLCELKLHHTLRVMNLCEEIAISLNFSKEEIELAKLCGLLHDIGRFEQWKRFNTFNDSKSIDHGDLGVEFLTHNNNNLLRIFIEDEKYDSIILNSIKYHNKYKIPNDLTEQKKEFIKIVRDADKIDILYLYTIEDIHLDTNNEKFSDKILECLINQQEINRKDINTKADRLAISLGFLFDINYQKSFSILKNKNYYNKEIDIYKKDTKNKKFINQLEQIKVIIDEYINERIDINVR